MKRQQRHGAGSLTARRVPPPPAADPVEGLLARGIAAHRGGRLEEADGFYRQTLRARPDHPGALHLSGDLALAMGRFADAEAAYRRLLAREPHRADLWHCLGLARQNAGRPAEAVEAYERAVAYNPEHAESHNNMGVALHQLGHPDRAAAAYRRAVALKPDYAAAHANLGITLKVMGDFPAALASFDRAIALHPDYPTARHSRALLGLTLGRFGQAWVDYLSRDGVDRAAAPRPVTPLPADLTGRRLRVLRDQGLGDELFFLRFVGVLVQRGARVAYEPNPKIAAMVGRIPFIERVVAPGEAVDGVESSLSVGDLPYLAGMTDAEAAPPPVPLPPTPRHIAAVAARLADCGPRPWIGVTWRAGSRGPEKLDKEAPLDALARALAPTGATILALQRHPAPGEVEALARALGGPVADLTALNEDLEDMLALMALIDDYVAVSNTNLHLRAGCGKTCRVMVPNPPEFRWMAGGSTSPWFPGFSIFRQTVDGDWEGALEALAGSLPRSCP